jgi:hypothetical protein
MLPHASVLGTNVLDQKMQERVEAWRKARCWIFTIKREYHLVREILICSESDTISLQKCAFECMKYDLKTVL